MKIESILRRPGGTRVTLDGIEYHFKPDRDGREFADVTDQKHIGIFLAVTEGYRPAGQSAAPTTVVSKPQPIVTPESDADAYAGLDRQALGALFQKKFGRYPPPRLGETKIIEALKDPSA